MLSPILKSTQTMNWIALLTFVILVMYVIDQYRAKNFWGFAK